MNYKEWLKNKIKSKEKDIETAVEFGVTTSHITHLELQLNELRNCLNVYEAFEYQERGKIT